MYVCVCVYVCMHIYVYMHLRMFMEMWLVKVDFIYIYIFNIYVYMTFRAESTASHVSFEEKVGRLARTFSVGSYLSFSCFIAPFPLLSLG